jgi:hypothetical protein
MGKKDRFTDIDMALLQAYLHEMFTHQTSCKENFTYTEWYLEEKYSDSIKEQVLKKIKEAGINCDCGVVEKIKQTNWAEISM